MRSKAPGGRALIAVLLVGCTAAPAGTGGTPPTASTPTAAATTPAATTAAATTAAPTSTPTASPTTTAIDVETVLPDEAGGQPLETVVRTPDQLRPERRAALEHIATQLGVDIDDLAIAVAYGGQSQGEEVVTAVQVPGADTADIEAAVATGANIATMMGGIRGESETVGGKDVLSWRDEGGNFAATFIYVVGDVFFVINASDEVAAELLEQLP